MNLSAKEICKKIGGVIIGNKSTHIAYVCGIEKTKKKSICYINEKKFEKCIFSKNMQAAILILESSIINKSANLNPEKIISKNLSIKTIIKVNNAKQAFSELLILFSNTILKNTIENPSYISNSTVIKKNTYVGAFTYIDEKTKIQENVKIFPNCFIGKNVTIGKETIIYSGVKIYDNSKIGSNCTIHSGAVIGADGFGFLKKNNKNFKINHIGNVIIKNNVEIGANTCIDRGKTHTDSTRIEDNVKIDNLVQIGHNVIIGKETIIAGCTGIAGSTKIGKECLIGGQVAISDHLIITDNVKIAGNSGVTKSILKKGMVVQGLIAFNKKDFQKSYIHFKNLNKN